MPLPLSSSALAVRLACAEDAVSIALIYNQGVEEGIATFETAPRTADQMWSQLEARADRYPTVVATRDGRVIAWAGVGTYRSRECYAGVGEHISLWYRGPGL
jgi:L-amino acid N-acyltransferase YncA